MKIKTNVRAGIYYNDRCGGNRCGGGSRCVGVYQYDVAY